MAIIVRKDLNQELANYNQFWPAICFVNKVLLELNYIQSLTYSLWMLLELSRCNRDHCIAHQAENIYELSLYKNFADSYKTNTLPITCDIHTGSLPYDLYIVQIIFLLMFLLLEGNYFKHIAKHTHTHKTQ